MGSGGVAELTTADIQIAIGYAEANIPKDHTGILSYGKKLILARCTDCQTSINALEKELAWRAVQSWWEIGGESDSVSKLTMKRLGKALVYDHRIPDLVRKRGEGELAHFIGVNYKTWKRKYAKIYSKILLEMRKKDGEMETELAKVLTKYPRLL